MQVMVDERTIENLEKRVGEGLEKLTTNYDTLAGDVKEIKDAFIGSDFQQGLIHEHREVHNWYRIANSNGELAFLSQMRSLSKGLYVLATVIGVSSVYNLIEIAKLFLSVFK